MQNKNTIKYFEYLRKSSEGEDRQIQSIDRQHEECAKVIKERGLSVVDSFSESRSAKIPKNRPAFDEMIRRLKKGEAQGIVCWHLNRLSRNPLESGMLQQMLADGIILSIQTKEKEYLPTDNNIIISVESGMASQYSKDLGLSVKSGIDKKLRQGVAPMLASIGYLNTKHEERGANYIIKDPERFNLMRKAWDMMLTGLYNPEQILKVATDEWGLRTRATKRQGSKPLGRSNIYRIFTDPFYAGLFVYNGTTYKGKHEPMITLEEYDKVQILLGKKGKPRYKKHQYAYSGIMKCGECESRITPFEKTKLIKQTGKLKTYVFYYCARRKGGSEDCSQRRCVRVEKLEEMITAEIKKYSISERFRDWALEILREESGNTDLMAQSIFLNQTKELTKLQNEIKNLFQMRLNESISDEEYKKERGERENWIFRIQEKLDNSSMNSRRLIDQTQEVFERITNMSGRFQNGDLIKKKEIFLSLGWNYEVKDKILFISKHRWLKPIEERREMVQAGIDRFELENNHTTQGRKEVFDLLRPLVRDIKDVIRTVVPTSDRSEKINQ